MSSSHIAPPRGSDRAPMLEHALVEDFMRAGIISCGPESDLTTVRAGRTTREDVVAAILGVERELVRA